MRTPSLSLALRQRRSELRLTQAAAAAEMGVSTSTLSKWERGDSVPSAGHVPAVAALLGVPIARVEDLVTDATEPSELEAAVDRIAALEARCAQLEAALAVLDAAFAEPVTELSDAYGNSVTLDAGGVTIDATVLRLGGGLVQCSAPLASFDGVVKADAVLTNSVVASEYTPGTGNVL